MKKIHISTWDRVFVVYCKGDIIDMGNTTVCGINISYKNIADMFRKATCKRCLINKCP